MHNDAEAGTVAHAFALPSARAEEAELRAEAERIIGLVGMEAFADKFASELSYGTLRLLELGCMLALKPNLLCSTSRRRASARRRPRRSARCCATSSARPAPRS